MQVLICLCVPVTGGSRSPELRQPYPDMDILINSSLSAAHGGGGDAHQPAAGPGRLLRVVSSGKSIDISGLLLHEVFVLGL